MGNMCPSFIKDSNVFNSLGGEQSIIDNYRCVLKEQSEKNKFMIYNKLFSMGVEGSLIGTNCPYADNATSQDCPFNANNPDNK